MKSSQSPNTKSFEIENQSLRRISDAKPVNRFSLGDINAKLASNKKQEVRNPYSLFPKNSSISKVANDKYG